MAALPMGGKSHNTIVEESFTEIINNRFKGLRVICKYCHKKFDQNTS